MFGKYLAGLAEVTEVLLVVLGFGLIAVEIFVVPGTLIAGVAGAAAVIGGLVMATQQTLLPQPDRPYSEMAWWSTTNSIALGIAGAAVAMVVVANFLPRIPLLNRAILRAGSGANLAVGTQSARTLDELQPDWRPAAGARGTALTVLRPAGKVVVDGHELDAVSDGGFIDAGGPIEVVKADPGRLVVRGAGRRTDRAG
jgi:membrane-bound serine protease (ClpP class)